MKSPTTSSRMANPHTKVTMNRLESQLEDGSVATTFGPLDHQQRHLQKYVSSAKSRWRTGIRCFFEYCSRCSPSIPLCLLTAVLFGVIPLFVTLNVVFRPKYTWVFDNDTEKSSAQFFRLNDPKLGYNANILDLQREMAKREALESQQAESSIPIVSNINVRDVGIWTSDRLRFDIIQHYWADPTMMQPWMCVTESDVVIQSDAMEEIVQKKMDQGVEFLFVEHFWVGQLYLDNLEKASIGFLCVPKKAGFWNHFVWGPFVNAMYGLPISRFIAHNIILFPGFANWDKLHWTEDRLCNEYDPLCNLIHFCGSPGRGSKTQKIRRAIDMITEMLGRLKDTTVLVHPSTMEEAVISTPERSTYPEKESVAANEREITASDTGGVDSDSISKGPGHDET